MAVGDSNLFLSRDTRVFIEQNAGAGNQERTIWELNILNGYSFSQTTNTSDVTISEMTDAFGRSRRGKRTFNDSLSPAEWSFSTYARPTKVGTNIHRAPEEVLWASLFSESNTQANTVFDAVTSTVATTSTAWTSTLVSGSTYEVSVTLARTPNAEVPFRVGDFVRVSGLAGTGSPSTAPNGTFQVSFASGTTLRFLVPFQPAATPTAQAGTIKSATLATGTGEFLDITATSSNKTTLNTFNLYFVLGGRQWTNIGGTDLQFTASEYTTIYRIAGAVVNEVTSSFDIDGITTLEWSGMGSTITELASVDFSTNATLNTSAITAATAGVITLTGNTVPIAVNTALIFTGTSAQGLVSGTTYYVIATSGPTNATLSATLGGSALTTTAGAVTGTFATAATFINTGITSSTNLIRNRVSQLVLRNNLANGSNSLVSSSTAAAALNTADSSLRDYVITFGSSPAALFAVGDQARVSGYTGAAAVLNGPQTVTAISGNTMTISSSQNVAITGTATVFQTRPYSITLTGGSLTISNDMTFLTPESLGIVNQPLGHITGGRSVSGSFTCYMDEATGGSLDLYQDMLAAAATSVTTNFEVNLFVGGRASSQLPVAPGMMIDLPACNITIPSINVDDVMGFEVNFTALPSTLSSTDEISKIRYVGV